MSLRPPASSSTSPCRRLLFRHKATSATASLDLVSSNAQPPSKNTPQSSLRTYRHSSAAPSMQNHIWISDHLLAYTWGQFVSSSRRYHTIHKPRSNQGHGEAQQYQLPCASNGDPGQAVRSYKRQQVRRASNVPGPLEANRRLAKRKNTGLAVHGGGSAFDFGAVFGSGRNTKGGVEAGLRREEWREDTPSGMVGWLAAALSACPPGHTRDLPYWSRSSAYSSQAAVREDDWTLPDEWADQVTETVQETSSQGPVSLISKCLDLDDARRLVREQRWDLLQYPTYSHLILDHFLEIGRRDTRLISEFLDDPTLNTRSSRNFSRIVDQFQEDQEQISFFGMFFSSFQRSLAIGLISRRELFHVIQRMPYIRSVGSILADKEQSFLMFNEMILTGLESCSVISRRDIGPRVFDAWLFALSKTAPTQAGWILARQIAQAMHSSGDYKPRFVQVFLSKWMVEICPLIQDLAVPRVKAKTGDERGPLAFRSLKWQTSNLEEFLHDLPKEVVAQVVIDISERLFVLVESAQAPYEALRIWRLVLRSAFDPTELIEDPVWMELGPVSDTSRFGIVHRAVARLWTLRNICLTPVCVRHLKTDFPEVFNTFLTNTKATLSQVHDAEITAAEGIFRLVGAIEDFTRLPETLRINLLRLLVITDIPTTLSLFDIENLSTTKSISPSSYKSIAQHVKLLTPLIQDILIAAIQDPNSEGAQFRLLSNNNDLKHRLQRAGELLRNPRAVRHMRFNLNSHKRPPAAYHTLFPYLHLLDNIAVAAAQAPNLTPTQAFKRTKWVYQFLGSCNTPPSKTIVRALYHAAVIRYQNAGLPVARKRWMYVMKIVERTEGRAVVEKLMSVHWS